MTEPTRDARGRFTSAGASAYGRRGAKERERRFLERHALPATRRRMRRQELSSAIALVHLVYGPPRRPRRVPRLEREMMPRLVEVIDVLHGALEAEQTAQRLRAAETLLYLWSRLEAALSDEPGRGRRSRRSDRSGRAGA